MADRPTPVTLCLERDPRCLLRLLVLVGVVSMMLTLSLTGYGIYRQSTADVLRAAEDDAVRIAAVMVAEHEQYFYNAVDDALFFNKAEINLLNQRLRKFLHPFGIVKIKVYNLDRIIVFSTDEKIIGMKVTENTRLERAIRGEIDSHQETKEQVVDLAEEQRFDVDVVEIYLPVYNVAGRIAGSFELYLDVSRYRKEIWQRVSKSIFILGIILLGIFSIAYLIVHLGAQQLKELLVQLHRLAITDSLTGALNRGAVIHRGEEELYRMQRNKTAGTDRNLGVIMIDLDYFKKVNDTYGHQTGDEVLREMTRRVRSCLRKYDVFGRFGGEEFLVIVPDINFREVMSTAERIRSELVRTPFRCNALNLQVTASFGVTCCYDPAEGLNRALHRADGALYQAKAGGRDRIIGTEWKTATITEPSDRCCAASFEQ